MGGPPFRLGLTTEARAARDELKRTNEKKWKKVNKALKFLETNPHHPGLHAHKWPNLKGKAPDGGDYWNAYVENDTPSAWRIFFYYPRDDPGAIYVTTIEPHR